VSYKGSIRNFCDGLMLRIVFGFEIWLSFDPIKLIRVPDAQFLTGLVNKFQRAAFPQGSFYEQQLYSEKILTAVGKRFDRSRLQPACH